ncbi:MAG: Hypoxanthine phosphoribosyltransferase [Parcubacteria group bacterium GW2011_GWA2_47_8]|nr:MAG: Hypoxanthine phosphoribosyltransferase [Parcubacteria group bacterium GW2011_GWA2_47_8]
MRLYDPSSEFERVLYKEPVIQARNRELGKQISLIYQHINTSDRLVAIGLMRGALPFMADIGRAMGDLPVEYELLTLSSYRGNTHPGEIELVGDIRAEVTGQHVLLLDDICDTGHTLNYAVELFKKRNPSSIRTCCLLDKPQRRAIDIRADFIGFVMENDEFVVGYGLDYNGRYRNLPYIAALHPRMYKK